MVSQSSHGITNLGHHRWFENLVYFPYLVSSGLLYRAPELLRVTTETPGPGSQKGDVYSFAIILYELHSRKGPFGSSTGLTPRQIVHRIIFPQPNTPPLRWVHVRIWTGSIESREVQIKWINRLIVSVQCIVLLFRNSKMYPCTYIDFVEGFGPNLPTY